MLVQKSTINHFPQGFIVNHFKDVLMANTTFTGKVENVSVEDDTIDIKFLVGLTDPELVELDLFISNYLPDQYYNISGHPTIDIYGSFRDKCQFVYWQTIKTFIFPGIAKTGYPSSIYVIASIDPGVIEGNIRIYSLCCRDNVATIDITTTEPSIYNLGKGTNWPIMPGIMEIQMKRTTTVDDDAKYIHFNELKIEF